MDSISIFCSPAGSSIPLAHEEKSAWQHYLQVPRNLNFAISFEGYLDETLFGRSLDLLVSRHLCLHTAVEVIEGQPFLRRRDNGLGYTLVDLRALPKDKRDQEFSLCWESQALQALELDEQLARATLYRLGMWHHTALLCVHPLLAPYLNIDDLTADFAAIYQCLVEGRELDPVSDQVPDTDPFAALLADRDEALDVSLAGVPPDQEPMRNHSATLRYLQLDISRDIARRARDLCERIQVPFSRLVFGVVSGVLSRYTGLSQLNMAVDPSGLDLFVEDTTKPRAVALDLEHLISFREWVTLVNQTLLSSVPLDLSANVKGTPMLFAWRSPFRVHQLDQLTISREVGEVFPVPLAISALDQGEQFALLLQYDPRVYDTQTIERLMGHLETKMTAAVTFPDQPVNQLPMLTRAERGLLRSWHDTACVSEQVQLVHHFFERACCRDPRGEALRDEQQSWRFRDLESHANQLAHFLLAEGVRVGDPIGLAIPPSPTLIWSFLGILKAGGVVLPMDTHLGQNHLEKIIAGSRTSHILTVSSLDPLFSSFGPSIHRMDLFETQLEQLPTHPPSLHYDNAQGALLRFLPRGEHLLTSHQAMIELIRRQSMLSGPDRQTELVYVSHLESDSWSRDLFASWRRGNKVFLTQERQVSVLEEGRDSSAVPRRMSLNLQRASG